MQWTDESGKMPDMTHPAGWYPDNNQPNSERWFDGNQWTEATRPVSQQPPGFAPQAPLAPKRRKKWPWIVAGAIVLLIILGAIGSASSKKNNTATDKKTAVTTPSSQAVVKTTAPTPTIAKTTPTPKPSNTDSVSQGFGTSDATGDIKVGAPDASSGFGIEVPITITNHSSKRSDYFVDIALVSADGKTQYDTGTAFAQSLESGQSTIEKAYLLKVTSVPAGAKVKLTSVQRTESN